jgi:flagellar protein FlaG
MEPIQPVSVGGQGALQPMGIAVPKPQAPDAQGATEKKEAAGGIPRQRPPTESQVEEAVGTANRFMQALSQNLQFSVDKESGKTVIKVVDSVTKEVVRQYPPEEMLEIARALGKLQGLLLREQA